MTRRLVDADGSESLNAAIDDIPIGVTISDGTNSFTATRTRSRIDMENWNLTNLSITPPANSDQDFTLKVEIASRESDNNARAVVTENISVVVNAVADLTDIGCPRHDHRGRGLQQPTL